MAEQVGIERVAGTVVAEQDKTNLAAVVIDFYAPWCGPCRMMGPVMESLAEEYAGKVRMYKVNVDKEKRLAAIFRVRSIPTFLFIPMSGEPKHANGAMEIAQMRRIIDTTLLEH